MWYPEEPVSYCPHCDVEIPVDYYWRGRGFIIGASGKQQRTPILYSVCPRCERRFSVGLDGAPWHRMLYGWMWKLRYPHTRPPRLAERVVEQPRRRAVGE